jgi:pyruvate kinase
MTSSIEIARRLCLTWGTNCVVTGKIDRFKDAVIAAVRAAKAENLVEETDMVVVTAGVPFNTPGSTNILRVAPCSEKLIFASDAD